MTSTHTLIEQAYAAFNARDIEKAFALMSDDVSWPKASEGGRVVGKEAVRDYWTRQWQEFDPHVEPVHLADRNDGAIEVKVRQVVKDLQGALLSDSEVWHVFTIANGVIHRMDLESVEELSSMSAFRK